MAVRTAAAARPVVKSTVRTTSKTAQKSGSASSSKSNANKAIKSALASVQKTAKAASSVISKQSNAIQNMRRDTFTKTSSIQKSITYASAAAQASKAKSSTNTTPYNILDYGIARKAGVALGSNKTPRINNSTDARNYQNAQKSIGDVFWCQTGGWFDDGFQQCGRTSIATMISLNSGKIVKPTDTEDGAGSVTVNGNKVERQGSYDYDYNLQEGAPAGYAAYGFKAKTDLTQAINKELSEGRSVSVKVIKGDSEHWITIVGSNKANPQGLGDYLCVDPWYNGNNTQYGAQTGTGQSATSVAKSGVICATDSCVDFMETSGDVYPVGYRMMTYRQ